MVALFRPPVQTHWGSLSFVSTLYLCPVLDRLMDKVPHKWQPEIRLGLQEALVNAVKHGNCLDPRKVISVRYRTSGGQYWWVIEDQGSGFDFENCDCDDCIETADNSTSIGDCGRGLYILSQVFDEVQWTHGGRELHLRKRIHRWFDMPLVC